MRTKERLLQHRLRCSLLRRCIPQEGATESQREREEAPPPRVCMGCHALEVESAAPDRAREYSHGSGPRGLPAWPPQRSPRRRPGSRAHATRLRLPSLRETLFADRTKPACARAGPRVRLGAGVTRATATTTAATTTTEHRRRLRMAKSAHSAGYAGGGPVRARGPASQRPATGTGGSTPPRTAAAGCAPLPGARERPVCRRHEAHLPQSPGRSDRYGHGV
jgi:hypothetical protein